MVEATKHNVIQLIRKDGSHSTFLYKLMRYCKCWDGHANALWHLHKIQSWWKNNLISLWSSGLPLEQRIFLWDAYWVYSRLGRIFKSDWQPRHIVHNMVDNRKLCQTYLWTFSFTTTFPHRLSALLAEDLRNTFGYLDKFYGPYPTMPIFSNGQNFWHNGPFGCPQ